MYGDASLDTGVGYTGLVGQINGVTVVWRSQALVDLMQNVPKLCCDNKGAAYLKMSGFSPY